MTTDEQFVEGRFHHHDHEKDEFLVSAEGNLIKVSEGLRKLKVNFSDIF